MAKPKAVKMKITTRAVVQRINRKLKPDLEQLRVTRGERMQSEVGYYHVIDFRLNAVTHTNVNPEAMARDLGVLKDYEEMVDDE